MQNNKSSMLDFINKNCKYFKTTHIIYDQNYLLNKFMKLINNNKIDHVSSILINLFNVYLNNVINFNIYFFYFTLEVISA